MTMLSPLGRVPRRRPVPLRRPVLARRRRPLPALLMIGVLSLLAGAVWWQVLQRPVTSAGATAGCVSVAPGQLPSPKAVQVRVYNATERSGLARNIAGQLTSRGFRINTTGNAPLSTIRGVQGVAEVRYGPAGAGAARLLHLYFPGSQLLPDARTDSVVDVALGPRFRALASQGQLARTLRATTAPAPAAPSSTTSGC